MATSSMTPEEVKREIAALQRETGGDVVGAVQQILEDVVEQVDIAVKQADVSIAVADAALRLQDGAPQPT